MHACMDASKPRAVQTRSFSQALDSAYRQSNRSARPVQAAASRRRVTHGIAATTGAALRSQRCQQDCSRQDARSSKSDQHVMSGSYAADSAAEAPACRAGRPHWLCGYSSVVRARDCGSRDLGSTPSSHRNETTPFLLLDLRLLITCSGVQQAPICTQYMVHRCTRCQVACAVYFHGKPFCHPFDGARRLASIAAASKRNQQQQSSEQGACRAPAHGPKLAAHFHWRSVPSSAAM